MKTLFIFFASCLFLAGNSFVAAATQQSIDEKIFQTFADINARSADLAEEVNDLNLVRADLENQILETKKTLTEMPEDKQSPEANQTRRTLQSEIIDLSARHLKISFEIVSKSEDVVSDHLNKVNQLTDKYTTSPTSKAKIRRLKRKIENSIQAGKSIHQSLTRMVEWSKSDPLMKNKFKDLKRILSQMDTRTSLIKSVFPNDKVPDRTEFDSKMFSMLELSTKKLINNLANLKTEQEKLKIFKSRLEQNIHIIRIGQTLEIVATATPEISLSGTASENVTLGSKLDSVMDDVEKNILKDWHQDDDPLTKPNVEDVGTVIDLKPGKYKNF